MATTKSFDMGYFAYKGAPVIWGSLQDVTGMTAADKAAPFLVALDWPGVNYVMDTRGRLTNVNLTNAHGLVYNLDNAGNRTSVVTS